jgi:transmembrane sensor
MDAFDRRQRETEEAAHWWMRLGTLQPEEVSGEDREAFIRWLRESPLHVAEMLRLARVHRSLKGFRLWNEVADSARQQGDVVPFTAAAADKRGDTVRRTNHWRFAAAATVVLAVAATVFMLPALRGNVIATAPTERREVMLDDGSVVKLEPESRLRVSLGRHDRRVTLERGRVFFRVAKDANRPFTVEADRTLVRVVGTAFGIEQKDQSTVVTVSEGKVAAHRRDEKKSEVLLVADQQLTVQRSRAGQLVRNIDSARALAWTEGRLVFDSAPLGEVVDEFNRYNHVRLRVEDSQLASRPVSGVFNASDPETLLAFIREGAPVSIHRENARDILIVPRNSF